MITPALFERYPTLESFAEADVAEVEQYIRSCGFFHTKARDIVACAQTLLAKHGGKVPDNMEELLALPGVGRKTANLILGDVFRAPGAVVVDTHCIRLSNRMGFVDTKDPPKIEAALRAVRCGRDTVEQADLEESVEVVIAGYQRKGAVIPQKEKEIVAYHEVGHALVAARQTDSAPVHKITIVPRTSGALGYTMQVDEDDRSLMSRQEALNKIATLTGGRAAEELVFHSATTGASNDIEQATRIARAMVTRFGMSEQFGMVALETVTNQYLGGDASLACSAETAAQIDREVIAIVRDAHQKALDILSNDIEALHSLARYLLEKETITGEEFMRELNAHRPQQPAALPDGAQ